MNTDPTSRSMRYRTRRALLGWRLQHSRSRWKRALAALLLAGAVGLTAGGCDRSLCPPTVPGVGTGQGQHCDSGGW